MASDVSLPPGFVLEDPNNGGLPPGFVLEGSQPQSQAPAPVEAPADNRSTLQKVREKLDDATRGLVQGLTFNFGDELTAGAMTPIEMGVRALRGQDASPSAAFNDLISAQRTQNKLAQARSPVTNTASDLLGGLVTGGGLARGGATLMNAANPTIARMALRGALEGAGYGAASGLGAGEDIQDRLSQAAQGAATGLATGAVTGGISGKLASRNAVKAVPSVDDLEKGAQAAYDAADKAGVLLTPKSYNGMVQDLRTKMANEGIDATLQPQALHALNRLTDVAQNPGAPTFKGLDILRRVAQRSSKSSDASERRLGQIMIGHIDDYVNGLGPGDVIAGDPQAGAAAINEARSMWSRMQKGSLVEDLLDRSKLRNTGTAQAIRAEFTNLARNRKLMRTFTPTERDAIKHVAKGGRLLDIVGRFSPLTNPLNFTAGSTAAGMMFGPLGTVAVPVAGAAARGLSSHIANTGVERLGALMRSGGNPAPYLTPAQQATLRSIIIGGAEYPSTGQ